MSESDLIRRAMEGDLSAWRGLHGLYYERLWYEVLHKGVHKDHAKDVLQVAFAKAIRSMQQFRGVAGPNGELKGLYTWIRRIVHNACIDWHRSQRSRGAEQVRVVSLVDDEGRSRVENLAEEGVATADERVDRARLGRALLVAIHSLPDPQRLVVEQNLILGRPLPDVAREHSIAIGTAKSRLRLARQALRAHAALADFVPGGDN